MNDKQCSSLFEEVFDSHSGGIRRECCCGRTYFNYMDSGCFNKGELETLERKSEDYPDKFIAVDHTIGTLEVNGLEIVIGCSCDSARKIESFIICHAERISKYLRLYAKQLRDKAEKVDVPETEF